MPNWPWSFLSCCRFAVVTVVALNASLAAADQLPSSATAAPLTLSQCLRLAAARNETPAIAAARLDQARAALAITTARLRPEILASGRATRGWLEGGSGPNDRAVAVATIELPLIDAPASNDRRVSALRLRAEQQRAAATDRELAFAVADAYHTRIASLGVAASARARVDVTRQALERERRLAAAGVVNRQAVTRAELDLAVSDQIATARANDAEIAELTLRYLIAVPLDARLGPPVEPRLRPAASAAIAVLLITARANRPDIRAAEHELSAAQQAEAGPGREWIPRVVAGADAGLTWTDRDDNGTADWDVYLGTSWTLFDGGGRGARSDLLNAQAREQALNLAQLLRSVDQSLRAAMFDRQTATVTVRQGAARLALARQNADQVAAQADGAVGRSTWLEALDARTALTEAEADLVVARLALATAELRILRELGAWPEELP